MPVAVVFFLPPAVLPVVFFSVCSCVFVCSCGAADEAAGEAPGEAGDAGDEGEADACVLLP